MKSKIPKKYKNCEKFLQLEGFEGRKEKKIYTKWTEDRKNKRSETMKEHWKKSEELRRKIQNCNGVSRNP